MDKFFSNLTGNNKDDKNKKDTAKNSNWQGGRSDMTSIKNKSSSSKNVKPTTSNNKGNEGKNIFANANQAFQKQMDAFKAANSKPSTKGGHSLGGSKPGLVYPMSLSEPGTLGIDVEQRKDTAQTAIVCSIVPNSQADRVGLKRGDIICRPEDPDREFPYHEFLRVARSGVRPLQFYVRRMESSLVRGDSGTGSADAMHRKQAMIAAAEAREAKHKALVKPVPKITDAKQRSSSQEIKTMEYVESDNIETKQAVEAVKAVEKSDAENLGYNPYEARAMTGGQARTATVAMTRGDINAENAPSKLKGGESNAPPANATDESIDIPQEFDYAFSTLVTTSSDAATTKKSLATMRKLIINATTKGQSDDGDSSKFRRVRLSNPKIKEVITDVHGALELMMAVGFVLSEEDGETYLVYPYQCVVEWLGGGLAQMERYELGG